MTYEFPPNKGGAGTYCKELAMNANKQSIHIEVWAPKNSQYVETIQVKALPWKGSQSWLSSIKLMYHIRTSLTEDSPVILHIGDPGVCKAFIRLGWLVPKSFSRIITIHGSELLKFTKNPVERFLFRKLLTSCQTIHVLSNFNKNRCVHFCKHIESKIVEIPGAPSSVVLAKNEATIKSKETGCIQILCVGRIHPRKGQLELLKALNALPTGLQRIIKLNFVGPVNKISYIKKIKKNAENFLGQIKFTGEVSNYDLSILYQSSDIFSLTPITTKTSIEGFGFVFLEASTFGLPIIATNVGGVEDAVLDGKTGLLSEPNNQENLKNNIIKLVESRSLRNKLGSNGIEWAKKHSWEAVAKKLYLPN